jgi:hypothetical protein
MVLLRVGNPEGRGVEALRKRGVIVARDLDDLGGV